MKAVLRACQSIQFIESVQSVQQGAAGYRKFVQVIFPPCSKWKQAPVNRLRLWPGKSSSNLTTSAFLKRKEMAAAQALAPAIVVYVTVPNQETGKKLAKSIITNKLAACVNQVPGIESTYWWKGEVETDSELLLIIKTRQSLLEALTQHVKENHPYEVPEVISLPITGGNEQYLKWLHDSTADHKDS